MQLIINYITEFYLVIRLFHDSNFPLFQRNKMMANEENAKAFFIIFLSCRKKWERPKKPNKAHAVKPIMKARESGGCGTKNLKRPFLLFLVPMRAPNGKATIEVAVTIPHTISGTLNFSFLFPKLNLKRFQSLISELRTTSFTIPAAEFTISGHRAHLLHLQVLLLFYFSKNHLLF